MVENMIHISTVKELLSLAVAIGARRVRGWSEQEEDLSLSLPSLPTTLIVQVKKAIRDGHDPLGDAFSRLLPPEQRRPLGAVYTPPIIVEAMLRRAKTQANPERIVDPGTGSGRFLVASGRTFKHANLVGIECDPVAAILARGHIAASGLAERSLVLVRDYRDNSVTPIQGQTLFIGNPPYIRHHLIDSIWKQWLLTTARKYNYSASGLAGLHVHFFLATAEFAKEGDIGIFITSSEWLDVNYGSLVRELFLGYLGGTDLHIIEPTALPFPGTATTGVITGFTVGSQPKAIGLRRVEALDSLGALDSDWKIRRERLENE